jgi:hypothetical protein
LVVEEVVLVVDGVEVGLGVEVAAGAAGVVSAMTFEGPNGVSARAIETTSATVTAGYATTARTRTWRALPLFMLFTLCDSVGLYAGLGAMHQSCPATPDMSGLPEFSNKYPFERFVEPSA